MSFSTSAVIKRATGKRGSERVKGATSKATAEALMVARMGLQVFNSTKAVSDTERLADISTFVPKSTSGQYEDLNIVLYSPSLEISKNERIEDASLAYSDGKGLLNIATLSGDITTWLNAYNAAYPTPGDWVVSSGSYGA